MQCIVGYSNRVWVVSACRHLQRVQMDLVSPQRGKAPAMDFAHGIGSTGRWGTSMISTSHSTSPIHVFKHHQSGVVGVTGRRSVTCIHVGPNLLFRLDLPEQVFWGFLAGKSADRACEFLVKMHNRAVPLSSAECMRSAKTSRSVFQPRYSAKKQHGIKNQMPRQSKGGPKFNQNLGRPGKTQYSKQDVYMFLKTPHI